MLLVTLFIIKLFARINIFNFYCSYTKDQCKNKLSNLKRGYKKYLRLMNSSGEGVCMHVSVVI